MIQFGVDRLLGDINLLRELEGRRVALLAHPASMTADFEHSLDALRGKSYNKLWNLYGNVDWMDPSQLTATFSALSPAGIVGETQLMQDRQSRQLFGNVSDRLSMLGTGQAKGISFIGGAAPLSRPAGADHRSENAHAA